MSSRAVVNGSAGTQPAAPRRVARSRRPEHPAPKRPSLTHRGERTRSRLLGAAEEVFSERSFDEASIVLITARAGVAMGTFYLYFPSKQAVFSELVRDLGHRLRSEIARAVRSLASRVQVEREGFRAFFEFTRAHPGLYRIVRQAEFVDRDAFRNYYERLAAEYAAGLEEAMRSGELRRGDPEALAFFLMGIGDMVGMRWILWGPEGRVPDRLLDELIDFVLHGAASEREAPPRRRRAR